MSQVKLVLGDCLDVLRGMEPNSVDAVVTDPPYGIGFTYASHNDTPDGYGDWVWSILLECERLCTPGSPVFVWQAMLNVRHFAEWFPRDYRIFAACKNFIQMRPTAMQYAFDPVLVWWTEGKAFAAGTSSRDWHIGNTANTLNRGNGDAMGHPCARPLNQVQHIIRQWVRPGGIVLDPFLGSGTTAVAAILEGRSAIGIEIDPTYYAIAERRIAQAQAQPPLIPHEAAPQPVQNGLYEVEP